MLCHEKGKEEVDDEEESEQDDREGDYEEETDREEDGKEDDDKDGDRLGRLGKSRRRVIEEFKSIYEDSRDAIMDRDFNLTSSAWQPYASTLYVRVELPRTAFGISIDQKVTREEYINSIGFFFTENPKLELKTKR